jgi:hypothetical protein
VHRQMVHDHGRPQLTDMAQIGEHPGDPVDGYLADML